MLVGLHTNLHGRTGRALKGYESVLDFNGIDHIRLNINDTDFWDKVAKLDLFVFRWSQIDDHHQLAKTIIPIIENEMRIKCYPDMATCWHYDDKIRQYYLLKQHGFPVIESWIFWDKKAALEWVDGAEFPLVFKLKGGAGSENVVLLTKKSQARRLIRTMFGRGVLSSKIPGFGNVRFRDSFVSKTLHRWGGNVLRFLRDEDITRNWQRQKNYVLFQKFLSGNAFDTRVTVIGDRAFAFRRFNRKNDFRSSGSGKINYDMDEIDMVFIREGYKISKALKFQSMAYDFLYDEAGRPALSEISYTYVYDAVRDCPGYWDSKLDWHEGHFLPQYFQLMDALNLPDLKQPDLKI